MKNKRWGHPGFGLMDPFFSRALNQMAGSDFQSLTPNVNIAEDEKTFILEVAAPGLSKENFNIEVEKDVLSISASVKSENKETNENKDKENENAEKETKKPNYLKREFSYHSFKRSFNIPESVDVNAISASYKDGVLKVQLPKLEKSQVPSAKTISIA